MCACARLHSPFCFLLKFKDQSCCTHDDDDECAEGDEGVVDCKSNSFYAGSIVADQQSNESSIFEWHKLDAKFVDSVDRSYTCPKNDENRDNNDRGALWSDEPFDLKIGEKPEG